MFLAAATGCFEGSCHLPKHSVASFALFQHVPSWQTTTKTQHQQKTQSNDNMCGFWCSWRVEAGCCSSHYLLLNRSRNKMASAKDQIFSNRFHAFTSQHNTGKHMRLIPHLFASYSTLLGADRWTPHHQMPSPLPAWKPSNIFSNMYRPAFFVFICPLPFAQCCSATSSLGPLTMRIASIL